MMEAFRSFDAFSLASATALFACPYACRMRDGTAGKTLDDDLTDRLTPESWLTMLASAYTLFDES